MNLTRDAERQELLHRQQIEHAPVDARIAKRFFVFWKADFFQPVANPTASQIVRLLKNNIVLFFLNNILTLPGKVAN